jgi:hypothetical protein
MAMGRGVTMLGYFEGGSIQEVVVTHRGDAIFWASEAGLEDARFSLRVTELTTIVVGRASHLFSEHADPSRCLSLVSPGISLNIETASVDVLSAWLPGLHALLRHYGRDVVLHSEEQGSRLFRVVESS